MAEAIRLRPEWNLECADPVPAGLAGTVLSAIVAAALAARGGSPLRSGGGIPVLGLTAAWLLRRARRRPTGTLVEELLQTLEARDRYTASHCSRVAAFADLIAEDLGLTDRRRLRRLRIAALLHDLGKLDVDLAILHKPGALDESEWDEMRGHAMAGARRASHLPSSVCRIIAQHHERPDGRGYPRSLRGDEICLEARIVAVADAFDAMTSDRPYREALSAGEAMEELRRVAPRGGERQQFDPDVVAALGHRFTEAVALCSPELARHSSPAA